MKLNLRFQFQVLKKSFSLATLGFNLRATNYQTSHLISHYQSSHFTPFHGTKVVQVLFMKIGLIIHQNLNFNTEFQGLRLK